MRIWAVYINGHYMGTVEAIHASEAVSLAFDQFPRVGPDDELEVTA